MKTVPETIDECKDIFVEIVRGYSYDDELRIFFKHHSECELAELEAERQTFYKIAKEKGLLREKEKLQLLNESGHWTTKEEQYIEESKSAILSLNESSKKFVIPQQIELAKKDIQERTDKLEPYLAAREELVGLTAEIFVSRRISEKIVIHSIFKDKELLEPVYEYGESEIEDLSKIINTYNRIYDPFNERSFRRISVCPFFVNLYSISKEMFFIFNKPFVNLTIYQTSLILRANFYKSLFESGDSSHPPQEYYDDIGKVVRFYDQQYSIIMAKRTKNLAQSRKRV